MDKIINKILNKHCHFYGHNEDFPDCTKQDIINAMKEYAREACKEQREICAMTSETPTKYGTIQNAPEPELK